MIKIRVFRNIKATEKHALIIRLGFLIWLSKCKEKYLKVIQRQQQKDININLLMKKPEATYSVNKFNFKLF